MSLGAFALSYDALRQMAAASHVHPALTYVFPLLVDGFIALGIGALLVLHASPLRARLYVATLVALATVTSIWANVLHAIRLNQQARHTGLPLDDITVGAISAIAPLALAGAVHFYLLVQRQPAARHNTADTQAFTRHKSAPCPNLARRRHPPLLRQPPWRRAWMGPIPRGNKRRKSTPRPSWREASPAPPWSRPSRSAALLSMAGPETPPAVISRTPSATRASPSTRTLQRRPKTSSRPNWTGTPPPSSDPACPPALAPRVGRGAFPHSAR
ncbi:DUF2637 domain-containing protein [Streptomyces sp. MS1.HAVA.3]|uniref:DUF2637 domain-containing protein n=1 Tax=Streptomyces caledonius TaxID=3134107 RepID=A0ABU8U5X2_9ACTN